jgi:cytosine deaminase
MQGRVTVSHAYALGQIEASVLARVADALARANVSIMTNAPGNHPFPPVRELVAAGVAVFAGNDNIRDSWWPYGDGDMLERAMMIAYRSGFLLDEELGLACELATNRAARALGIARYGLAAGNPADFIAVRARSIPEAVVTRPVRQAVYKRGRRVGDAGAFAG